jgi:activator of HSP90 ATPase
MATIKLNRALVLDTYGFHAVNEIVEVADEHVAHLLAQHGNDVSLVNGQASKKGKHKEAQPTAEEDDPAESDLTPPETVVSATTGTVGSVPNLPTNPKR